MSDLPVIWLGSACPVIVGSATDGWQSPLDVHLDIKGEVGQAGVTDG
jgi:hypothetical protein